jgi:cell fate regulator YaaT (PSP1 superfamily)
MSFMNVVGVQFRRAGKIYDFLPGTLTLRVGDQVVVDTERGSTLAKVVRVTAQHSDTVDPIQVKPVLRIANDRDLDESGHFTEDQVMEIARSRVEAAKLDMRIMKAELQMSGNKITVYFSSPGRVDFRDLVKDLAGALRARVELKQVGARDEAKLVGGVGICGREYCCSSFLRDFVPVSIKMAKNQNLALNPNKVSGGCGRLLCCLTYENEAYIDLRRKLPALKSRVRIKPDGDSGNVYKTDILNQMVVFETADGRLVSAKASEIELVDKSQQGGKDQLDSEADVWAEDIDLNLLMGDGEPKSQKPQYQGQKRQGQKHGGGDYRQGQQGSGQGQQNRETQPGGGGNNQTGRRDNNRDRDRSRDNRPPNQQGDKPKKPQ